MNLQALPAFSDNYIWVLTGNDGRALIVDPGEAAPVLAAAEQGLQPAGILLTHHHHDHIGGTAALLRRWPGLPVIAPADERIDVPTHRVGDGERVAIAGWEFEVIALPGHTVSHVAFFGHGLLFCGDTLFSLGCGRLFEGSPAQMLGSLSRLAALPADTRVCCGHEYTLSNAAFARVVEPDNPALRRRTEQAQAMRDAGHPTLPSTIADERACNPFLRVDQPAVIAAVTRRLGNAPDDAVETFAELRRWKDGFVA
ncbi:hydroxyacylglutathione hydrolase [Lysobacter koreensis]|uniref:Hydroxyacylglutathione hydrolase n=1 Tax=Lysobacter koreensis TaxID=266122 RepID=A0ABW2YJV2_9GAMM